MTVTRPARALGLLAATLALAAGPAACGGEDGGDDKSEASSRVKTFYGGFADKDPNKICDSLSKKYKDTLTKQGGKQQSCEKLMGQVIQLAGSQLQDVGKSKVSNVKVDGDKATATVEFRGKKGTIGLTKEDDDWKVENLNAAKL